MTISEWALSQPIHPQLKKKKSPHLQTYEEIYIFKMLAALNASNGESGFGFAMFFRGTIIGAGATNEPKRLHPQRTDNSLLDIII